MKYFQIINIVIDMTRVNFYPWQKIKGWNFFLNSTINFCKLYFEQTSENKAAGTPVAVYSRDLNVAHALNEDEFVLFFTID